MLFKSALAGTIIAGAAFICGSSAILSVGANLEAMDAFLGTGSRGRRWVPLTCCQFPNPI